MVSHWFTQRAGVCAVATAALFGRTVFAEDQPKVIVIEAIADEGTAAAPAVAQGKILIARPAEAAVLAQAHGKFWIGAGCDPVSDTLKAQLNLQAGLVVADVLADSPAAKAEIKPHDILLRFGDAKLTDVRQLVELVDKQGAKAVDVVLLRGGKEQTVSLQPAERPKDLALGLEAVEREIKDKLEEVQKHQRAVTMSFVRPGVVLPPGHAQRMELPSGMSISIQKDSDKPARIVVKKGEKTWEVTDDKLSELPEDVRPFVEQMRGQTIHFRLPEGVEAERKWTRALGFPGEHAVPAVPGTRMTVKALPPGVVPSAVPGMPPTAARVAIPLEPHHKQLAELNAKLDQVLKAVQGPSEIEALDKEVSRLRKEVEALRKQFEK